MHDRDTDAGPVHHSDRCSQYLSIRYAVRLAAAESWRRAGSRVCATMRISSLPRVPLK